MIQVAARATPGIGLPFAPLVIERRDVGPRDVLIDIAYAGICHTDISHARSEWEPTIFPLVAGHEIAGIVSAIGSQVTKFAIGDHAGVGVMVDSCRTCVYCRAGHEQHCQSRFVRTYNCLGPDGRPTHGGYSEKIVVDQDFALRLPPAIALPNAAPLLCAGVTVYSPLRRWGGERVGVVGFGGLGHLAVQISKAFRAHVTVFDLSADKRADALRLGADEYVISGDPGVVKDRSDTFDLIISTVPAGIDVDAHLSMLGMNGVLVNLGVSEKALSMSPMSLLVNARAIAGSSIGGIAETQEMLDFCGTHGISSVVEVITADQIDEAYKRLDAGDVRYRFVIDTSTIAPS